MTSASRRNDEEEIPDIADAGPPEAVQARKDLRAFFLTLDAAADDLGGSDARSGEPNGALTKPGNGRRRPAPVDARDSAGGGAAAAEGTLGSRAERSVRPRTPSPLLSPAMPMPVRTVADTAPDSMSEGVPDSVSEGGQDSRSAPTDGSDHASGIERIRRAIEQARKQRAEAEALARGRDETVIRPAGTSPDKAERLALAQAAISTQRHWLDHPGSSDGPSNPPSESLRRTLLRTGQALGKTSRQAEPSVSRAEALRGQPEPERQPLLVLPPPIRATAADPLGVGESEEVPRAAPPPKTRLQSAAPVILTLLVFGTALSGAWFAGIGPSGDTAPATSEAAVAPSALAVDPDAPASPAPQPIGGSSTTAAEAAPAASTVDRANAPVAPSSPEAVEAALAIGAVALADVRDTLVEQGYLPALANGDTAAAAALTPDERNSIAAWQADRGLAATGFLDMETFALMMSGGL